MSDALLEEYRLRKRAENEIRSYIEYIRPSEHSDFQFEPAVHHGLVIDRVERLILRKPMPDGRVKKRLLIMLPPGGAKSTYISVIAATWYQAKYPGDGILCCSASQGLAERFQRRRRSVIGTSEWQKLSSTSIDPSNQGLEEYGTLKGGLCKAAGTNTTIIGIRTDLSIIDDPHTSFEETRNDTLLDKIWDWYEAEYRSRQKPECLEIVVTTRWARHDLAGRILDWIDHEPAVAEEWEVLRIPMEADSDDDPLGRELGDRLWPDWYTEAMVRDAKRDPLKWNGMYQQVPLDAEGEWVPEDRIKIVKNFADGQNLMAMDLALSVGKGDFSVIGTARFDHQRFLTLFDLYRGRASLDEVILQLFQKIAELNPAVVLIDDDPAAKVFVEMLYREARTHGVSVPLLPVPLKSQDKETRAAALRGMFMQNQVRLLDTAWTPDAVREIYGFPGEKNDDIVDVLSLMARHVQKIAAPERPQEETPSVLTDAMVMKDGIPHFPHSLDRLFGQKEKEDGTISMTYRKMRV